MFILYLICPGRQCNRDLQLTIKIKQRGFFCTLSNIDIYCLISEQCFVSKANRNDVCFSMLRNLANISMTEL